MQSLRHFFDFSSSSAETVPNLQRFMSFDVPVVVVMTPCSLVNRCQHVGGTVLPPFSKYSVQE